VDWMVFVIPVVGIVFGMSVVLVAIWTEHKRDMALIEKGLYQASKSGQRGQSALLWGLILAFVGTAVTVASGRLAAPELLLPGLIGAAIGIALLVYSFIIRRGKPAE